MQRFQIIKGGGHGWVGLLYQVLGAHCGTDRSRTSCTRISRVGG